MSLFNKKPMFSICHTTARTPDGWKEAARAWMSRCDRLERMEYILCVPEAAGSVPILVDEELKVKVIAVPTSDGSVKGWNAAAKASTGYVLIGAADDFFPPEHWDTELLKVLPSNLESVEAVVHPSTGEGENLLLTHVIMTRKRYERFGYLHHPDYLGVMADDEFTIRSYQDRVVIEAPHLKFEHRHPNYREGQGWDSIYDVSHSDESWRVGRKALSEHFGKGKPIFSLVHASARVPDGWEPACLDWVSKAAYPEAIEYVLATDAGDPCSTFEPPKVRQFKHVINSKRKCAVDAWNCAAEASTGKIIVTVSDDWVPPQHWDLMLLKSIPDIEKPYVVWVATGGAPSIMTFSILTRPYYESKGYLFYPEYIGMYADNDFTEVALRDKVVIDCRETLPVFQHLHPEYGTAENDPIYERQHRSEAWRVGEEVFNRRVANGFKDTVKVERASTGPVPMRRKVAMCLPHKDHEWLSAIFSVQAMFNQLGFEARPVIGYTSGTTDLTRIVISETVLKFHEGDESTPYVYWNDDDNIVPVSVIKRWVDFMEVTPQCDILVGWCWIVRGEAWICSVGTFNENGTLNHYTLPDVFKQGKSIRHVPSLGSGFPAVLMRREVLEKLGAEAFHRIPNKKGSYGFMGEDISFFWRAKQAGFRCYFDPMAKLGHLQLSLQEPQFVMNPSTPAEIQSAAQRVAGKPVEVMEELNHVGI